MLLVVSKLKNCYSIVWGLFQKYITVNSTFNKQETTLLVISLHLITEVKGTNI